MPGNAEILTQAQARVDAADWASGAALEYFLEIMDSDVVWDPTGVGMGGTRIYNGHEGLGEFMAEWAGAWKDGRWYLENERVREIGSRVLVWVRMWGTGAGSGAEVEWRFAQIYTFRDGKVIHYEARPTWEEALELAR